MRGEISLAWWQGMVWDRSGGKTWGARLLWWQELSGMAMRSWALSGRKCHEAWGPWAKAAGREDRSGKLRRDGVRFGEWGAARWCCHGEWTFLSADPRCESGERRGFTHLTKIVTCRVLEAVTW